MNRVFNWLNKFGSSRAMSGRFSIMQEHQKRLSVYAENWDYYKGTHWTFSKVAKISGDEQGEYRKLVKINYIKAITDLHINFLMKKGFTVSIPNLPETAVDETEKRKFIQDMLDKTWDLNNKIEWAFECAQVGSVTGDVFLYHSWVEGDVFTEPYVKVDILPSQYCFPVLGGPHGVDRKEVIEFIIQFPIYNYDPAEVTFGENNRSISDTDVVLRTEVWTNEEKRIYIHKSTLEDFRSEDPVEIKPNILGFIPIVHITNFPIAGEYYGAPDLTDIVPIQREFNRKATDISNIINYHGSPVTILEGIYGTQLERGPDRMWSTPLGSDVKNLEMKTDLRANIDFLERLRKAIFEMSSTPNNALGQYEPNNSAEAGAAIAIHYLPMLDRHAVKAQMYGNGIRLSNQMIIRITELADSSFRKKMNALGKDAQRKYHTDVSFPEPFPRNESLELENIERKQRMGIITRERALVDLGVDMVEAAKIVAEWYAQSEKDAELAMKHEEELLDFKDLKKFKPGKAPSGNPRPIKPNPEVSGESVSRAAERDGGT